MAMDAGNNVHSGLAHAEVKLRSVLKGLPAARAVCACVHNAQAEITSEACFTGYLRVLAELEARARRSSKVLSAYTMLSAQFGAARPHPV